MSGRRAKALRRALEYGPGWAAIDLPGCKVMRHGEPGRWRAFPPSWRRLLRRKRGAYQSVTLSWTAQQRMLDPDRTGESR